MQPNQNDDRSLQIPPRDDSGGVQVNGRNEAVEIMRNQIDRIYDEHENGPATQPASSPYRQTHSEQTDHQASDQHANAHWKQYHTAWQSYYQQYYERYYMSQVQKRQTAVAPTGSNTMPAALPMKDEGHADGTPLSRDQAVSELRSKLMNQVKVGGTRVRKSRHFMPIIAALVVGLTFALLQYNRLIVAQVKAYVSPGSISAANIVIDPTTDTKVNPAPKLIIPKINVDAPVVYDVPSIDEHIVQDKLKSGVVHYPIPGASSVPGQAGNTVVLGHSSNDVFDDGAYKFVFVQLDKLDKGDTFYLNYNGTRYTYSVTEKKIILPTEVSSLVLQTDKPMATLVTCTPIGTALKRLVIIAEQISPDPTAAAPQAATDSTAPLAPIAGNSPTLFERIFGN